MSSSEFWDERYLGCKGKEEKEVEKDDCDFNKGCDRESAKALKKILSLIDELNNQDLRLLDEIIERILCERKH